MARMSQNLNKNPVLFLASCSGGCTPGRLQRLTPVGYLFARMDEGSLTVGIGNLDAIDRDSSGRSGNLCRNSLQCNATCIASACSCIRGLGLGDQLGNFSFEKADLRIALGMVN